MSDMRDAATADEHAQYEALAHARREIAEEMAGELNKRDADIRRLQSLHDLAFRSLRAAEAENAKLRAAVDEADAARIRAEAEAELAGERCRVLELQHLHTIARESLPIQNPEVERIADVIERVSFAPHSDRKDILRAVRITVRELGR